MAMLALFMRRWLHVTGCRKCIVALASGAVFTGSYVGASVLLWRLRVCAGESIVAFVALGFITTALLVLARFLYWPPLPIQTAHINAQWLAAFSEVTASAF